MFLPFDKSLPPERLRLKPVVIIDVDPHDPDAEERRARRRADWWSRWEAIGWVKVGLACGYLPLVLLAKWLSGY
jgi:hypothetical protein